MAKMLDKFKTALGLDEKATVVDVRTAFERHLEEELTPEEKENEKKKREAAEAKDKAEKDKQDKDDKAMSEVKVALGLKPDATPALMLSTVKTLAGDKTLSEAVMADRGAVATLSEEVKQLSEKVATLTPKAELAESLQKDSKKNAKEMFFAEMVRTGRCLPAEREFQARMYDLDESGVRKFLGERKPQVHLAERPGGGERGTANRGAGAPTVALEEGEDPRAKLRELAETKMAEKKIGYAAALDEVRGEHVELAEQVDNYYRPGARR